MANENNNIQATTDDSQIVLYQPDDSIRLEVKLDQDTVWLTQAQMTELFRTTRNNITMHIRNIFKEKELDEKSVCKESLHTAADGKRYRTKIYNLDVIISVGYRVKSPIIIIDGYVSSLTLSVLDVRKPDVTATIYTAGVGQGMQRLMDEHDRLFPDSHINIRKWRNESHDRWLIIDDSLYLCGHSLNANGGHKISAITLMGTSPEVILSKVE